MPVLQAGFERFGDQVAFVGVDHEDSRDDALAFVQTTGVRYRSGYDPAGSVARTYGLLGLPTTVIVAADGTIPTKVTGALTSERLRTLLAELGAHDG